MTCRNPEARPGTVGGMNALHNSGCAPRTHLHIRPLHAERLVSPLSEDGRQGDRGAGLRPVAVVDPDALVRCCFPPPKELRDRPQHSFWRDWEKSEGLPKEAPDLRLRCLVLLSRLAGGELKRVTRRQVRALGRRSRESLEETWLDNVSRLDPAGLGLPPFGLARPLSQAGGPKKQPPEGVAPELDPARVLALLSRTGGRVYSAGRTPLLPDFDRSAAFVLYACAAGAGAAVHDSIGGGREEEGKPHE